MNRLVMKHIIKNLLPLYGNPESASSKGFFTTSSKKGSAQWEVSGSGPIWVNDNSDPEAIQRYVINMIIQGEKDLQDGWWGKNKGAAKIALVQTF